MVVFNSLIESTYNCLKYYRAMRQSLNIRSLGITLNPRRITIKFPSALVCILESAIVGRRRSCDFTERNELVIHID